MYELRHQRGSHWRCCYPPSQMYQAPPFRLSYKVRLSPLRVGFVIAWSRMSCQTQLSRVGSLVQGLGEPLCFVAYGPLATNAFYYAMAAAATHTPTELSAAAMAACVLVRHPFR